MKNELYNDPKYLKMLLNVLKDEIDEWKKVSVWNEDMLNNELELLDKALDNIEKKIREELKHDN